MAYFKVVLEEGKKKKSDRVVYMQGKDLCDTVLGNYKRFNHAKILDCYEINRDEFFKAIAAKE